MVNYLMTEMLTLKVISGLLLLLSLFHAKMVTVRDNYDPGSCSKSNHGDLILVKDRENRDTMLICTEGNGVYKWQTTDNSKPSGEYFDPGFDCLDILNKNTKAKDGYYWVDFHLGKPIKVYCDMSTDGGGYILIGRMNDTVTWNVPSSNKTVEPFGHSHWSSELGDVSVLDFRIQVASDDDFQNTLAHWAFRFKNKRQLKNLMILDQGGCPHNFPGVGDVSYIKDLMTEEIVSKDFSCSIFGPYSHPIAKIGWTMMNLCLEKPCQNGFAYHPIYPFQVDFSGGFSYVIATNSSKSDATAFFGCEKGKCCACYGPPGGKDVYCHKECEPVNGGTVTKHASAWFWVRLSSPRKVWEKCMEYKSEDENGDSAWYKLVGDRNIPVKGRCGKSQPLINDGVVVLDNEKSSKRVPAVSGLLAYRKDIQSLHVRINDSWKALPVEEEINQRLKIINQRMEDISEDISRHLKSLTSTQPFLPSGLCGIYSTESFKVHCDKPSGWTLVARFSNQDGKNWMKSATFWFDRISPHGTTLDPSYNEDMISEAFWRTPGNEIKITRSDDPTHTALLETTNNCLKGNTFRQHITSFGNFRKGAIWSNDKCLSSCSVSYGGQYQNTSGFEMHSCNSDIQSSSYIGFWCNWRGDAAVMMIGGGGSDCGRADHGIGVTENIPHFSELGPFLDFGYDADNSYSYEENEIQRSYALNFWVR